MMINNLIYKSYYDWWKNINKTVLFLMIILFGLGLFFSLVSTSLIASDKLNTNSYYFFLKHFVFIGIGSIFVGLFFSNFFIGLDKEMFWNESIILHASKHAEMPFIQTFIIKLSAAVGIIIAAIMYFYKPEYANSFSSYFKTLYAFFLNSPVYSK